VLLLVAGLAGCCPAVWQAYPGPARPSSEIARITVVVPEVRIHAVDGEPTMCLRDTPARAVEVSAGEHEVEVRWYRPSTEFAVGYEGAALLPVHAMAGSSYEISAREGSRGVSFLLLDAASGQVLSSVGP